jgi:hypothetical protein
MATMTIRAAVVTTLATMATMAVAMLAVAVTVAPACAAPGHGGLHGPGGQGRHRFLPRVEADHPGGMPAMTRPVLDAGGDPRGLGRLSPEERRQLRRDIRNAGEDVYRRPPPAPSYPPPDAPPPG